ncbi:MAG TPA: Fic family protein [Patescibacteria group bacterium]|nr:Fic family protein [Patescibacteria group bacterium]
MYQPKFTITNAILKSIGAIEAAREVINHAPLLPYFEKKFREDALIRSVHYGTHLEGNELSLTEAEKVVMGQNVVARERDIQEVINYRNVIDFIGDIGTYQKEKPAVTEELIFNLHKRTIAKILPPEVAGFYRKTQVVIKSNQTGVVVFRPPLAIAVPYQIADLLTFINEAGDVHPVLKSGIVHYEFVRIHPFVDGNGRVARALSTLILFLEGYDIRQFFSLEEYFDTDAITYYDCLQSVEKENNDMTQWLTYFAQGLAIELNKIKERVERVSVDTKIKEKLGGKPLLLTDRQMKIVEYIRKVGYLQNQQFKTLFPMISEDAVLLDLKSLIQAGLVKKSGVTRGAKYVMV